MVHIHDQRSAGDHEVPDNKGPGSADRDREPQPCDPNADQNINGVFKPERVSDSRCYTIGDNDAERDKYSGLQPDNNGHRHAAYMYLYLDTDHDVYGNFNHDIDGNIVVHNDMHGNPDADRNTGGHCHTNRGFAAFPFNNMGG
jgi:hypothetical protein